ncbi:hypothetical protein CJ030_MR2G025503 [Morella rubra]|uniref:Uncharacterized protein n=1 Tax=Morella rubra TaxID=262757 RepID=A0A6A1UK41_9ROSI|nr:hypothetical protein CJ030_MR0G007928 [Morella rubra]KAB1222369.1 hypothetical protein CJ030_MR2G025503 [Morella rubra]
MTEEYFGRNGVEQDTHFDAEQVTKVIVDHVSRVIDNVVCLEEEVGVPNQEDVRDQEVVALDEHNNLEGGLIAVENVTIDEFRREIFDAQEIVTAGDTLSDQEEECP